ncbi:MAG: asparagine synthase-related protein [Methanomassiliicoccales archaeon]|uniref:asparagine synthase-related protein n=1 Tax=Candidatus Methanarcanum hacksteinii TaxID=2911857 RepID=UPI002A773A9A|nr:type II toxin-antitoxin system RelB/DinJ family antitoxin [Candidatus Methanomethylophilaceae archaeon]MCI6025660.1 asparagine synthase-related protein [Methanomassiliicoccales archaeon]MDD7478518.1 asparagine synthase-related protein [Methanomassiliicoccales archaeon]MDY4580691.1 asparagine synthase-related protein [Candidatus Methanarcanum hacksteinii]
MFEYQELEDALISFIKEKVEGKDVGVACSGGLDSGLVSAIAKEFANSVTLYSCGTKNAHDVMMTKDLSERLEIPMVHAKITKGDMHGLIREMIEIASQPDPFTISYEMPLLCVCKAAKEDIILTGQGADEYFMGCAKFVGASAEDYEVLKTASVERLLNVSVPCELKIAEHFNKTLYYPYLDISMTSLVEKIDPEVLRPKDMDSRKEVLRKIAIHLGYDFIAKRPKKSSQYGSGTTDLIRGIAKENNMMYAEYIASIRDEVTYGKIPLKRGSFINARIDPIVKEKAERILLQQGITPSEAIEDLYRKIIQENEDSL